MFDFLNSIKYTATNAVGSIANYFGIGSSTPAAPVSTPYTPPVNSSPYIPGVTAPKPTTTTPQTVLPNMSTNQGPAQGQPDGSVTYNTPQGATNVPFSKPVNSSPYIPGVTASAPTAPRPATVPAIGANSSSDWFTASGIPLISKNGAPIRGEAGVQGVSSVSLGAGGSSVGGGTPGANGASGIGTSMIGASPLSLLGVPGVDPDSPEAKALKNYRYNPKTGQLEEVPATGATIPSDPLREQLMRSYPQAQPTTNQVSTSFPGQAGFGMTNGGIPTPSLRYAPISAPSIPNVIDANTLHSNIESSSANMGSSAAKNGSDLHEITQNVSDSASTIKQNILAKEGNPTDMVKDDPAQRHTLDTLAKTDPNAAFNLKTMMDTFRTQNGMPQLESGIADLNATYAATAIAMRKSMEDIKSDSNLPQALRDRRVKQVQELYQPLLDDMEGKLKEGNARLAALNTSLNQQIGIAEFTQTEADKQRDSNLSILKMIVDNGGTLSPEDKAAWAAKLGLSAGALDSLVANPNLHYETSNGITRVFDQQGRQIRSYGTSTSSAAGGATFMSDLGNEFEAAVLKLGSVNAANNARAHFSALMAAGDEKGAQNYIDSIAAAGLTGQQKTAFSSMGVARTGAESAINKLNTLSGTGFYKNAIETLKPYAELNKDQNYTAFKALVESSQAAYRNALFGASLTGNELTSANQFLVDFSTDNINTIQTKLEGMVSTTNMYRKSMLSDNQGNLGGTPAAAPAGDQSLSTLLEGLPDANKSSSGSGGFFSSILSSLGF